MTDVSVFVFESLCRMDAAIERTWMYSQRVSKTNADAASRVLTKKQ